MRYILLVPIDSSLTVAAAKEACEEFGCSAIQQGTPGHIDTVCYAVSNNIEHLINMAFVCDIHGDIIEVKSTTKV